MIAYGRQSIDSEDIVAVADVLGGDYLTTGPKVVEFENALAQKCGVKYAVALSSGTAALHIGAKTIIKAGDKVLTTPISFVATANSILYQNAKPIFVDVDDSANIDLNLCEDALKKVTL
jgi:dTDP-4-amino-4,6-dideoxygalactose transaminase